MTPTQSNSPSNWGNLISEENWHAPPVAPPAEAFQMWVIGAAITAIALTTVTAAIVLWKRRK
jgi:hypothetical protein